MHGAGARHAAWVKKGGGQKNDIAQLNLSSSLVLLNAWISLQCGVLLIGPNRLKQSRVPVLFKSEKLANVLSLTS